MTESSVFRRKSAPEDSVPKSKPELIRLLLVDDDESMLRGCVNSAEQVNLSEAVQVLDVRTYLMTGHNGLMDQLRSWQTQEERWKPDLVLVDKNITSGHGTGLDYVSELQQSGDDWISVVVVLHTAARCNKDDAEKFSHSRADDYVWERTESPDYLRKCLNSLPLWRVQARSRLWSTLIDRTNRGMAQAENMQGAAKFLRENTFPFLEKHLGVRHGFVRELNNAGQANLVAVMQEKDEQNKNPTTDLNRLPLMRETMEEGRCERIKITEAEAGQYPVLMGKAMIGAALRAYGDKKPAAGAITLVRNEPFSADDLENLCRLAEPLGGLLVRQRYIEHRQEEQIAVRKFTGRVAELRTEQEVCQALVDVVHGRLNITGELSSARAEKLKAKTTVRLVPPGAAVLKRTSCAGDCPVNSADIPLARSEESNKFKSSIYRAAVKTAKTQEFDTKEKLEKAGYLDTGNFVAGSELCVPFRSRLPTGEMGAFGAINTEHHAERAYGKSNVRFVETLAQITASALMRLRAQQALKALADLALGGMDRPADEHWHALNLSLGAYAGHGVLIHLAPPSENIASSQIEEPVWEVKHVELSEPMEKANAQKNAVIWQKHFEDNWSKTFTCRVIKDFRAGNNKVQVAPEEDFVRTTGLLADQDESISFNAAIPLRHQGSLVGVWVLLFFTPPAFDEAGLSVLEQFGQYAAGLIAFQAKWNSRENQLVQAEQQARLSGAAQMFQHVLKNELFTLGSQASTLLRTTQVSDAHATARLLSDSLGKLEDRAKNLSDFMRSPQPQIGDVLVAWRQACRDILPRAVCLRVRLCEKIDDPSGLLMAWFDPLILQQVFFVILQNALDAIEAAQNGSIIQLMEVGGLSEQPLRLQIFNDGPPISENLQNALCLQSVVSTKPRGQGVALYFSGTRMRDMHGFLRPATHQPPQGCVFELDVPRNA